AEFARALQLDPLQLEAIGGLTALDFESKRQDEAIARLNQLVERAPKNPGLLLIAARAQAAVGKLDTAEALLTRTIHVDPGARAAYAMRGRVYLTQNKMDAARAQFERLAATQEKPVGPLTLHGMIDLAANRVGEARDAFERVLKLDAQAPVAANNLAWIYAE